MENPPPLPYDKYYFDNTSLTRGILIGSVVMIGTILIPHLFPILIFYLLYVTLTDIYNFFSLVKTHPHYTRHRFGDETQFGFGIPILSMLLGFITFIHISPSINPPILMAITGFVVIILLPAIISTTIVVGTTLHFQKKIYK